MRKLYLLLLLLCAVGASGHDFSAVNTDGKTIYYRIISAGERTVGVTYSGGSASAVSGEYSGKLVIPPTVRNANNVQFTVCSVEEAAFEGCSGLTSVALPATIGSFAMSSIEGCTSLQYLSFDGDSQSSLMMIPGSGITTSLDSLYLNHAYIYSADDYALFDMPSLTKVGFGPNVCELPDYFMSGTGVERLIFPQQVQNIGRSSFADCTSLKYVKMLGGGDIANGAFYGCSALETVDLGATETVGFEAFCECVKLKTFVANSVTSYQDEVFLGCTSLEEFVFPSSCTSIGDKAFYGCTSLKKVVLPANLTTLNYSMFSGCTSLTDVTLNNKLTITSNNIFSGCSKLASITIPASVTQIGKASFSGCTGLKKLVIADGSKPLTFNCDFSYAAEQMFYGAPLDTIYLGREVVGYKGEGRPASSPFLQLATLKKVTVGSGVKTLSSYLFSECTSLYDVSIASSVQRIDRYAFSGCHALANVSFSPSLTFIGERAFNDCPALQSLTFPSQVDTIGDYAFAGCSNIANLTIPSTVRKLSKGAFSGCSKLKSINIPASLKLIESLVFSGCSSLHKVTFDSSADSLDLYMMNTSSQPFNACPLDSVIIDRPLRYLDIKSGVFRNADCKLAYMKLGDNITALPSFFMYGAPALQKVVLPSGLKHISDRAFMRCGALNDINLSNVTSIDNYAFYECSALEEVDLSALRVVESDVFTGCTSLRKVIHAALKIKSSAFSGASALASFDFSGVSEVGGSAFQNSGLKSVVFPDAATTVGPGAFYGCSSMTSISFPASIDTIPNSVCSGCTLLDTVALPSTVKYIDEMAFSGCSSIDEIAFPASLEAFGQEAFKNCASLKSIDVPAGVKVLTSSLFEGCTSLKSVTIPPTVTNIDQAVFASCASLTKVNLAKGNDPLTVYSTSYVGNYATYTPPGGVPVVHPEEESQYLPFYHCPVDTMYVGRNLVFTADTTMAFAFMTKLRYVEIADNVNCIPKSTFRYDSLLQEVRCNSAVTPLLLRYNFIGCTIYVPSGSVAAYQAADCWKDNTIVGFDTSSLPLPSALQKLQDLLDSVQAVHDSSVEGYSVGQYCIGSRADLQSVITSVTQMLAQSTDDATIVTCTTVLRAALASFEQSRVVSTDDTDISQLTDALYINKVSTMRGRDIVLPINLKNSITATGFQFDLYLPDGITFVMDANNSVEASLSTSRTNSSNTDFFGKALRPDGSLRVLCYSTSSATFSGSDGEVMTVKIHVADTLTGGDYPIVLRNVEVTDAHGVPVTVAMIRSTLSVSVHSQADANGDNRVSVADLAAVASYILGNAPSTFDAAVADVNGDGVVNVADLSAIANIILYGSVSGPSVNGIKSMSRGISQPTTVSVAPFHIVAGGETHISIVVNNPSESFSGFQFDLYLPDGFSVKNVSGHPLAMLSTERTNQFATDYFNSAIQGDGALRVLCFSTTNSLFSGTDGAVADITIVADKDVSMESCKVNLKNVMLTAYGNSLTAADVDTDGTVGQATGIDVKASDKVVSVFDSAGRLLRKAPLLKVLEGLPQGTYIVDGCKYVVK